MTSIRDDTFAALFHELSNILDEQRTPHQQASNLPRIQVRVDDGSEEIENLVIGGERNWWGSSLGNEREDHKSHHPHHDGACYSEPEDGSTL